MIIENNFFPIKEGMTLIEYCLKLEEKCDQISKYKFGHFIEMLHQYLLYKNGYNPNATVSLYVVHKNCVERDPKAEYPKMLFEKVKDKQAKFLEFCEKQLLNDDLAAVEQELKDKLSDQQDNIKKGTLAFSLYFGNFTYFIVSVYTLFPYLAQLGEKLSKTKLGTIKMKPRQKMNGNFQWCFHNNELMCFISIDQIKLKTLKYCVILT